MRFFNKYGIWLGAIFLVISVMYGLLCFLGNLHSHGIGRRIYTREDMGWIAGEIRVASELCPSLIRECLTNREEVIASRLYQAFFVTNDLSPSCPPAERWIARKRLVDRWGEEFNFHVAREAGTTTNEEVFVITIWSNGPNHKNQQMQGDDIVQGPFKVVIKHKKQGEKELSL